MVDHVGTPRYSNQSLYLPIHGLVDIITDYISVNPWDFPNIRLPLKVIFWYGVFLLLSSTTEISCGNLLASPVTFSCSLCSIIFHYFTTKSFYPALEGIYTVHF